MSIIGDRCKLEGHIRPALRASTICISYYWHTIHKQFSMKLLSNMSMHYGSHHCLLFLISNNIISWRQTPLSWHWWLINVRWPNHLERPTMLLNKSLKRVHLILDQGALGWYTHSRPSLHSDQPNQLPSWNLRSETRWLNKEMISQLRAHGNYSSLWKNGYRWQ